MTSFSDQVKQFTENALVKVNDASRNIIGEIADELIFRTPHDTGRARANWRLGVDALPKGHFPNAFDYEGDATSNKLHSLIPVNVLGHSIYIANNVPYILTLEDGRRGAGQGSTQAPNGISKVTQLRFKTFIKRSNHVSR